MQKSFLIILILSFFIACKKSEEAPQQSIKPTTTVPHYALSAAIKNYEFKVGTYWLYHDYVNVVEDTLIITSTDSGTTSSVSMPSMPGQGSTENYRADYYKMFLRSSRYTNHVPYMLMGSSFGEPQQNYYYSYGMPQFPYWPITGTGTDSYGRSLVFQNQNVVLNTSSLVYSNCFQIKFVPCDWSPFYDTTYMTVCPDYGIIRTEMYNGTTLTRDWQLKDSHIVK